MEPHRRDGAAPPASLAAPGCLLVFTKPAVPGRVKTRLVGALTPARAAELHAALLADTLTRLAGSPAYDLVVAWAVADGEPLPASSFPSVRQEGAGLGERLYGALAGAARRYPLVAAVGSDHPELPRERAEEAFAALAGGADVAVGPAADGGYYLIAVRREALSPRLFAEIPWSGPEVLAHTLDRCAELGLATALLAPGADVDTPADLARLTAVLRRDPALCPRTAELLASWEAAMP